jgi:hypothetical protein
MQNQLMSEIEFRMNRLSVRLEQLATHFDHLIQLLDQDTHSDECLTCIQECKYFIEWSGNDLDFDRAYELLQMQRQLVQWQRKWETIFSNPLERSLMIQQLQGWATSLRSMLLVLA